MNNSPTITEDTCIPHATFDEALRRLDQCFTFSSTKTEAEGLAIIGESGTGKTSVLDVFRSQYPATRKSDGMEIPILSATVPSSPTVKSLAGVILEALRAPDSERGTENEKSRRIRVLMSQTKTRMLMIDEFQHFYDRGSQKIQHHVADWLKVLVDQTRTTLVVAGLPHCLSVIDQNEQLTRRFLAPAVLKRFHWHVEEERAQFFGILAAFEERLKPRYRLPSFQSVEMAFRFWTASGGLMGYLSKILKQAERNAIEAKTTSISLEDLNRAHREAVWMTQRNPDLPQPFSKGSSTTATMDVLELVGTIGRVPESTRIESKQSKGLRGRLNAALVANR